jgi:Carbohydrate esterase, sialic acid-specific acetylesterase
MNDMAMCRYQGESDATDDSIDGFAERTFAIFDAFREALAAPQLPMVQVAITATSAKAPRSAEINSAQMAMDYAGLKTVDASALPLQADGLHLTLEANIQLGHLLAEAVAGQVQHEGKQLSYAEL